MLTNFFGKSNPINYVLLSALLFFGLIVAILKGTIPFSSPSEILIVVFLLLVLIFAPLLTIWSLNTLFANLEIPYTMETWAATVIITGVIQSTNLGIKSRKDK